MYGINMECVLKFNLIENNGDKEAFHFAINGAKYYNVLHDFNEQLRACIKYNDNLTEREMKVVEKIQKDFYDILSENNVSLDI